MVSAINQGATATCAVNGIMNLVELDVLNLKRWLSWQYGSDRGKRGQGKTKRIRPLLFGSQGYAARPELRDLGYTPPTSSLGNTDLKTPSTRPRQPGTADDVNDPDNGEDVDGGMASKTTGEQRTLVMVSG